MGFNYLHTNFFGKHFKMEIPFFKMEKTREFQKNIYFCFTDYAKAFDCVDPNKLWKILKEMGIPDHLTCLLKPCMKQLELDMEQQTGSK